MNTALCFPPDTTFLTVSFKKEEDIIIDERSKRVLRNGVEINLTNKEFSLLNLLYSDRGKVFSTEEILKAVWQIDWNCDSNVVQVYFAFLRRKVDAGHDKKLIQTKQGHGYFLDK